MIIITNWKSESIWYSISSPDIDYEHIGITELYIDSSKVSGYFSSHLINILDIVGIPTCNLLRLNLAFQRKYLTPLYILSFSVDPQFEALFITYSNNLGAVYKAQGAFCYVDTLFFSTQNLAETKQNVWKIVDSQKFKRRDYSLSQDSWNPVGHILFSSQTCDYVLRYFMNPHFIWWYVLVCSWYIWLIDILQSAAALVIGCGVSHNWFH